MGKARGTRPAVPYNRDMACSVCLHANREAIDASLTHGKESARSVAARFGGVSKSAVDRHLQKCVRGKGSDRQRMAPIPPSAPIVHVASGAPIIPMPEEEDVTPSEDRAPTFRLSGEPGRGRPCLMCLDEHRAEVDRRLVSGEPVKAIVHDIWGEDPTDMYRRRVTMHSRRCIAKHIKRALAETNSLYMRPLVQTLNDMHEMADDQLRKVRADMARLDAQAAELEAWRQANPGKEIEYRARQVGFHRHKASVMKLLNESMRSLSPVLDTIGKRTGVWSDKTELVIKNHPKWGDFVKKAAELIAEIEDDALAGKFTGLLTEMES